MTLFANVEDLGIRIRLDINGCLTGCDSLWKPKQGLEETS